MDLCGWASLLQSVTVACGLRLNGYSPRVEPSLLLTLGSSFASPRLPRCHMPCMDTLQIPLPFPFSLCVIFLALTFHFMGSIVIFGFKAAERLWDFGLLFFFYLCLSPLTTPPLILKF